MKNPTEEAYAELRSAYDFFNAELFAGRLPACLITYHRNRRTYGYFCGDRWDGSGERLADEIALNPQHFTARGTTDVLGVRSPDGPKVTLSPHPNRESLDAAIAPPTALLFRNSLKGTDKLTRRPGLALLDRDLSALYVDASAHSERVLRSKDARRSHISEQK